MEYYEVESTGDSYIEDSHLLIHSHIKRTKEGMYLKVMSEKMAL